MRLFLISIATAICLTSCSVLPLRPGKSNFTAANGTVGSVRQSQNPQAETVQIYERISEPIPPVYGKTFTPVEVETIPLSPAKTRTVVNVPVKTTERIETRIGAAQKDTAREVGAKLRALSGLVWVGLILFLFGIATFVYPPLRLIIGSVTTSVAITGAGLALMILPSLIVGHELLILAVAAGGVGVWWFAHRHGKLQGFVDANKDNLDDKTGKTRAEFDAAVKPKV